jgi:copper ion binding protein
LPKDISTTSPKSLRFQVDGLSCASCVRRAETAIASVEGVQSAVVNLATGNADIAYSEPATVADIQAATASAGYPAATEELVLQVDGATCATCVNHIEKALKSVPGVTDASMNLANGKATVTVFTGGDVLADLTSAVAKAGYEVISQSEQNKPIDRQAEEANRLRRDFWLAFAVTLPVFIIEMGGHLFPAIHDFVGQTIGHQTSRIFQFVLTTGVLLFPGRRFFTKGLPALMRAAPDMNSLVALGASAAWAYSTITTFAPSILPEGSRNVYFESAAMIVTLILLGRLLEARAKGRTGDAIRKLVALAPDTALVERDGVTQELPIDQVRLDDILHLKPGERLAVDGVVTSGRSYVDESMISGEPVPIEKSEGASVNAGTVNGSGALTYRATAVGSDTMLSRIVRMVEDAQGAKLPIQALVDKITSWFVPVVMALAAITVLT